MESNHLKPIVVNKRLEPCDVYIGRGSKFGNPAPVHDGTFSSEESMRLYRHYIHDKFMTEPQFREHLKQLQGKKLGCFCKKHKSDSPLFQNDETVCHGDILVEYILKAIEES